SVCANMLEHTTIPPHTRSRDPRPLSTHPARSASRMSNACVVVSLTTASFVARKTSAALVCGGATCSGKAFVSQCAPEIPIGATSRQKVLRYQRTAHFVLNQAGRDGQKAYR